MRNFVVIAFVLVSISSAAAAASVCDELGRAVEDRVKLIAELTMGDGSESIKEMKKANSLSEIQANLTLMQANKCALPKAPIDYGPYLPAALECTLADSRARRAGDKTQPAECDRDKWVKKERTK